MCLSWEVELGRFFYPADDDKVVFNPLFLA